MLFGIEPTRGHNDIKRLERVAQLRNCATTRYAMAAIIHICMYVGFDAGKLDRFRRSKASEATEDP